MLRKKTAELTDDRSGIRWRSHEPARIETFSDAVFAFALTLVIVSLEVPKSFDELYETMRGTVSFAICFLVLFSIWNQQNLFFRRFGLKDGITTALNGCLLFMVLIYAYPLKFLFFLIFSSSTYSLNGHIYPMINVTQLPTLMFIYGCGFCIIYLLFFLMYRHALNHAESLELTPHELFITETAMWAHCSFIGIGLLAIILAYSIPVQYSGFSGFTYMLIPVTQTIWYKYRRRKEKRS